MSVFTILIIIALIATVLSFVTSGPLVQLAILLTDIALLVTHR